MVDHIIERLESKIKECKYSDYTQTLIPFYDTLLHKDKKKFLAQVKMSPVCSARVTTLNQQTLLDASKENSAKLQASHF